MDEAEPEAESMQGGLNYSPWVSVFNLCNAAIGAGVLSFPYAFRQTGFFGGLFITGLIWVLEIGALCLLVRTAETHKSKSYQELVVATLGPRMAVVTAVTMLLFVVGAMISYLIITGDVFQPLFQNWFGEDSFLADRRVVIALFATVVVLPLSLKRSLRDLKWTSTISVIMLMYLTVALGTIGIAHLMDEGFPHHVIFFNGGIHAFIAIDIVVFAFQCHIQVVPIFAELADEPWPFFWERHHPLEDRLLPVPAGVTNTVMPSKKRSSRLQRMEAVILISMTLCFICYCLVGVFGYLLFPDVESDILKSFGNNNQYMNFARIGMAVVSMVCYPLNNYPARSILDDALTHVLNGRIQGFSLIRNILLTLVLLGFALGTAILVTNLGTVFSIVGSTGGVMVMFIIPGLLLGYKGVNHDGREVYGDNEARLSQENIVNARELTKWVRIVGGFFLVGIGGLIFVATAYVTARGLE